MRCYLTYMYMYLLRPQTATAASALSNRYMFRLFVTYWYHSLTKARNKCILGHMNRLRIHSAIIIVYHCSCPRRSLHLRVRLPEKPALTRAPARWEACTYACSCLMRLLLHWWLTSADCRTSPSPSKLPLALPAAACAHWWRKNNVERWRQTVAASVK